MVASQIRANARESLTGKWGKAALITLTYAVIVFVIDLVCGFIPFVGSLVLLVISTPISYGLLVSFIKLKRNEEVAYTDFLTNGFSSFGKVWAVVGNVVLKMILPICLIIIFLVILAFSVSGSIFSAFSATSSYNSISSTAMTGFGFLGIVGFIGYIASLIYAIVKGFLYALSFYILNDNPDMTGKEIVEESQRLMLGNRWRYFWLTLSFIGWAILAVLTLYIGMLWLVPYMAISMICFYEDLAGKSNEPIIEQEQKVEE